MSELAGDHEYRDAEQIPAQNRPGQRVDRYPARSSRATRQTSPVVMARAAAAAASWLGSPPERAASVVAVISAVVDSGPTESLREEPSSAYTTSGSRLAHSPVIGGRLAIAAYP